MRFSELLLSKLAEKDLQRVRETQQKIGMMLGSPDKVGYFAELDQTCDWS